MSDAKQLNIVMIGATSAIVHAAAREFCHEEPRFFMVARNEARLRANADDLKVRGAKECEVMVADLADATRFDEICKAAATALGKIDFVLIGHGVLGAQKACEQDALATGQIIDINFVRQAQLAGVFANYLERQKSGTLGVITSVAGVRGRPSNYVYGSAKAGMIAFLEGMRARLFKVGVRVLDIRPGIVNTPMTEGIQSKPFVVEPRIVGQAICSAYHSNAQLIYVPGKWRLIMAVIRMLPRFIFNRLSL